MAHSVCITTFQVRAIVDKIDNFISKVKGLDRIVNLQAGNTELRIDGSVNFGKLDIFKSEMSLDHLIDILHQKRLSAHSANSIFKGTFKLVLEFGCKINFELLAETIN
jgi:hypothetical protein